MASATPAAAYLDRVSRVVPTKKQVGHTTWAEAWPTVHDPPEETREARKKRLKVRAASNEQWTGLVVSAASESAEIDDPNVIASSRSLDHLQHVQDIATKTQVKDDNGKCVKIPHNRWRARMLSVVSPGTERTLNGETVLWREAQVFVWDDSFEHEAIYERVTDDADAPARYVLYMSLWHPDLGEVVPAVS